MSEKILILGLGNIGDKYINTRHNVGFECVYFFLDLLKKDLRIDKYLKCYILSVKLNHFLESKPLQDRDIELIFALPTTFMNLSGECFRALLQRFSFTKKFIIYDDIDIKIGNVNFKENSGPGGHNGIKSLLSVSEDFIRVKIGIGANLFLSPRQTLSPKEIFLTNLEKRYLGDKKFAKSSFFNNYLNDILSANKDDILDSNIDLNVDSKKAKIIENFNLDLLNYKNLPKNAGESSAYFVLDKFNTLEANALSIIFNYIKNTILIFLQNNSINLNHYSVNLK